MTKFISFFSIVFLIILSISCNRNKEEINIEPHIVNAKADTIFQKAIAIADFYDTDSTLKSISIIDKALMIDSLNPDYYGLKAKLLSELGELDSALYVQTKADEIGAITGEYIFQLALFQSAKDMKAKAKKNFNRSNNYLQQVLKKYPDSLGAFIIQQAANALYLEQDSLFMQDVQTIRKQFPKRLMELEMTRRVRPSNLIQQIKNIEIQTKYNINFNLDSVINEAVKTENPVLVK